jgi:hypothetical protein
MHGIAENLLSAVAISRSPDREHLYGAASGVCASLPTTHDRQPPYELLPPVLLDDP